MTQTIAEYCKALNDKLWWQSALAQSLAEKFDCILKVDITNLDIANAREEEIFVNQEVEKFAKESDREIRDYEFLRYETLDDPYANKEGKVYFAHIGIKWE